MKQKIPGKDKSFVYKYPRLFVGVSTTVAMLVFFSKPIYDIFFSDPQIDIEELRKTHKFRFGKD